MSNFLNIFYQGTERESKNKIIFLENSEYVPVFLIPKLQKLKRQTIYSHDFKRINSNWSNVLVNEKINKFNKLTIYSYKKINNLIYSNFNSIDKLINYSDSKKEILKFISELNFNKINNSVNVIEFGRTSKLRNLLYLFEGSDAYYNNFTINDLVNFKYTAGNIEKNFLISQGFLGINFDQNSFIPLVSLMIKKDYVEEFMFNSLLEKPIDNSKFQWWFNSDVILSKEYKTTFSNFTKLIKKTPYEIVGISNFNDIIKNFKTPVLRTPSEIINFNKILTENANKFILNLENEVVESLPLCTNKNNVKYVTLKGIRKPVKKIITQLVE